MGGRGLDAALQLLGAALHELDEHGLPGEIGASVDLAICQLRALMDGREEDLTPATDFSPGVGADALH